MAEVTADQVLSKLNELDLHLSPEINYRLETIFLEIEGFFVNKKIREKFQLVQWIEPFLKEVLLEHEQVLFVSRGGRELDCQRVIFALTNLRMLCMHQTGNHAGCPYWTIYYSQIEALKNTFLEHPKFYFKDGTKLSLRDFPKQELPTLHDVFEKSSQRFQEQELDPTVSQSRENICGNCFKIVSNQGNHCEACGANFWSPFEIGIRSLFFPLWGSFTIRPFSFALAELSTYVVFGLSVLVLEAKSNPVLVALMFVLFHMTASAVGYKLTAKGLYLKEVPADSAAANDQFDGSLNPDAPTRFS
ncbi:hypothetical protein [Gimesia sp.]|uniref:hypothetical protein n=1 Tax=Gimesia sp. TaxID=2024833 RepID=UPI003A92F677